MPYDPDNPLVIQSDRTILADVHSPRYEEAREVLARFADLVKSPEHIHTYRLTPLSLWNAAASGMTAAEMRACLLRFSRYDVPETLLCEIDDYVGRYGRVRLTAVDGRLRLVADDPLLLLEIAGHKSIQPILLEKTRDHLGVDPAQRGRIKQELLALGFPVADLAGYIEGSRLPVAIRAVAADGRPFALRAYQEEAVAAFYAGGSATGGSGVVVLPCGAGKTMVGIGVMAALCAETLILTTNTIAVRQWQAELLDKTDLAPESIGEYTGERKEIRPVTVTTYQILTWRRQAAEGFPHFELFAAKNWGLIIYDEVHLLPAEVFRITAELQARRRLGLTATLVREDGRADDVFTLIGPKKYDVPWKILEEQAWIATAHCHEIRVGMPESLRLDYAVAGQHEQYRLAADNPQKDGVVMRLCARHAGERVLVIGQYLDQLRRIAAALGAPLITGATPTSERARLYGAFKAGDLRLLVVSKVANFAVDLPEAGVAIQVSGTFGSRQEEAQRLGRILRPKADGRPAHFYTVVTRGTRDQDFAFNRQLYLAEQGYRYTIEDGEDA